MLISFSRIIVVEASGTIYIRADGSIEPSTANITSTDNVTYTLTGNIINDSIVVERDNIVVDGAGYTLQGNGGGSGFHLTGINNVTIRNTDIQGFCCGVWLDGSSFNSIVGNNITNNGWYGVYLDESSNNNTISGNNITNNDLHGVYLFESSNNVISGNSFVNNGLLVWQTYGNVVSGNLVNGKPLVYLEEVSNYTVQEAGQVVLVRCSNIKVENLNLSNASVGVQLSQTNNTLISGNNITNNTCGVYLYGSSNNSIVGNNITNNDYGINLYDSYNITISGNNITNNDWFGVYLIDSPNNVIYHNNFVDNDKQVCSYNSINVWDNGFPSGGNYWGNYNGTDTNRDGIGDTSYVIDENNTDNYPLMGMFHDFSISNIGGYEPEETFHIAVICNSTITSFAIYPLIYIGYGDWVGGVIFLNVTGSEGTEGFCRFAIPKDLLDCPEGLEHWAIYLYDTNVTSSCNIWENSTHTFIYVPYNHSSQEIIVKGTWIVPEFPTGASILLMSIVLTIAMTITKRTNKK